MMHILLIKYGWLLVAAFVSGLVDTIAGGGGLITVPTLLLAGLPPAAALGTNKLQACFGSGTAAYRFIRLGQLRWQQIRFGILMTFIGSSLGTIAIMLLHPAFLSKIIPILLAGALVYSLLSKKCPLKPPVRQSGHQHSSLSLSVLAWVFMMVFSARELAHSGPLP